MHLLAGTSHASTLNNDRKQLLINTKLLQPQPDTEYSILLPLCHVATGRVSGASTELQSASLKKGKLIGKTLGESVIVTLINDWGNSLPAWASA